MNKEYNRQNEGGSSPVNRTTLGIALILVAAGTLYFGGAFEPGNQALPFGIGGALSEVSESRNLDLAGASTLQVRSFNGRLNISTGSGQAKVEVRRKGDVVITTEKRGSDYVVEARSKNATCFNCGVSFTLVVPEGMTLDAATSNGPVTIDGPMKGVRAHSSNGAIEVMNSGTGSVDADTSNGQVKISDAKGEVHASSSNGRITLTNLTFPAGSRNEIRTSNGAIEVRNVSAPEGLRVSGGTSNGGISVNLPGFEVDVDRRSFDARQDGSNPAELRLDSSNASLTVSE
jgi:hypothetical protein